MWRSLVAHPLWERRVAGSNPVIPTERGWTCGFSPFFVPSDAARELAQRSVTLLFEDSYLRTGALTLAPPAWQALSMSGLCHSRQRTRARTIRGYCDSVRFFHIWLADPVAPPEADDPDAWLASFPPEPNEPEDYEPKPRQAVDRLSPSPQPVWQRERLPGVERVVQLACGEEERAANGAPAPSAPRPAMPARTTSTPTAPPDCGSETAAAARRSRRAASRSCSSDEATTPTASLPR